MITIKYHLLIDLNKLLVPTPPLYDTETGAIIAGKDPDVGIVTGIFQSFGDAPGEIDENGLSIPGSKFKEEIREINISMVWNIGMITNLVKSGIFS